MVIEEYNTSKGVQQECPQSPHPFNIRWVTREALEEHMVSGVKIAIY